MAFTSIVVHQLTRTNPTSEATTQLSADTLETSGKLDELAYELKSNFIRKSAKHYGQFSSDTVEFPFASWLRECREERLSFISFTQKAVNNFKHEIDKTESLIDSYVFFLLEKIEAGDFLYVLLVDPVFGLNFDGDINLNDARYLDTHGFSLAVKIDITDWEAGDSVTYTTLMRARGDKDLSDAFTRFIGFGDKHDIKTDTDTFLQTIDQFTQTLDETTATLTRTKAVDYCLEQKKTGKPVVINELSQSLSETTKGFEPERFTRFVKAEKADLKDEFIADAGRLRNYIRISGRNDSLSMSFASECLGKEIVYDPQTDSLTIKNIPPALKSRLLKHLKND